MTENIETNPKAPKFKVNELLSIRIKVLVKVTLKIGQEKYLLSILFQKLALEHMDLKILTEKK